MHYYKFNIADWHLATAHLTLEEEAIYFRLINFYYDTEAPISEETHAVIRRLRLVNHSEMTLQILHEFFELTEKGFVNKKCDEILKEYRKTAKKNKVNGAKGGRPSKLKASKETQKEPSGLSVGTQVEPKHNPNHKPLTINHKPITKEIKTIDQSAIDRDCMFEDFWLSGIRKVNKKKAKSLFTNLLKKHKDPQAFTDALIYDVKKRLDKNQMGFAEMHPTTYLNGERWNDEVTYENPKGFTNAKPSAVDRVRQATEKRRAERAAATEDRGHMANPIGYLREQPSEPIRGGNAGSVGITLEGDYTKAD